MVKLYYQAWHDAINYKTWRIKEFKMSLLFSPLILITATPLFPAGVANPTIVSILLLYQIFIVLARAKRKNTNKISV